MRIRTFLFIAMFALAGFGSSLSAQKIASVDMEKILGNITEYQDAQEQLDQLAAKWQQDISQQYDAIKGMYSKYPIKRTTSSVPLKTRN